MQTLMLSPATILSGNIGLVHAGRTRSHPVNLVSRSSLRPAVNLISRPSLEPALLANHRSRYVCKATDSSEEDNQDLGKFKSDLNEAWNWLHEARMWLKNPSDNYKEVQSMLEMELGSMEIIVESSKAIREYERKLTKGKEEDLSTVWERFKNLDSMVKVARSVKATIQLLKVPNLALLEAASDWETELSDKYSVARKELTDRVMPDDLEKLHQRAFLLTEWLDHATQKRVQIESQDQPDDAALKIASESEIEVMDNLAKCRRKLRIMEDTIVPKEEVGLDSY